MPPRFFIIGPTASGKARVAFEVARLLGGEVISVDSMKVYRGMDVGTAKTPPEKRRDVRLHLVDVRDPDESMSVAEFMAEAGRAEGEIRARGGTPIFAGGTALYVRCMTEGVFEGPPADWPLRRRLEDEAAAAGSPALHERLGAVDPRTAARLHPNDLRRIIRALEVYEKTGTPISALQRQWAGFPAHAPEGAPGESGGSGGGPALARRLVGVQWSREDLNRRIDERVDRMFAAGFVDEARRLLERPRGIGREAEQALGYRELFCWLRAGAVAAALPGTIAEIKTHTRRFAKRQLTFFRHFPDLAWIPVTAETNVEDLALNIVEKHASWS